MLDASPALPGLLFDAAYAADCYASPYAMPYAATPRDMPLYADAAMPAMSPC